MIALLWIGSLCAVGAWCYRIGARNGCGRGIEAACEMLYPAAQPKSSSLPEDRGS